MDSYLWIFSIKQSPVVLQEDVTHNDFDLIRSENPARRRVFSVPKSQMMGLVETNWAIPSDPGSDRILRNLYGSNLCGSG